MREVTDPEILRQLEQSESDGYHPVTDPFILQKLNSPSNAVSDKKETQKERNLLKDAAIGALAGSSAGIPLGTAYGAYKGLKEGGEKAAIDLRMPTPSEVGSALQDREFYRNAGATVGSGAALGVTKHPGVALAAGGLGAAGGDALYNIVESARNLFSGDGKEVPLINPDEIPSVFTTPLDAFKEEMLWSGGLGAAGQVARGAKNLAVSALKTATPAAEELKALAARLGVPLGAIHVSDSDAVKGFSSVLGVFPFVGSPIKKSQQTAQEAIDRGFDSLLNTLAPTATLYDIGVDLTKAATEKFKSFRRISGSLYNDFLQKAENASVKEIFPTDAIKNAAKLITDARGAEEIALEGGKKLSNLVPDFMDSFIDSLSLLPDRLSGQQVRGLQRGLQEAMSKAAADGYDVSRGTGLKKALEESLNAPQTDLLRPGEGEGIKESLKTANAFFADNIKLFQTPTGQRFGRVDRNIFKPKFQKIGSREADETFNAVFNSKSPMAMQDLRELVGPDNFKKAARKHLDMQLKDSLLDNGKSKFFNPDRLEQKLGLNTPEGKIALEEMLKGSPVGVRQLEDFVKVAKSVGEVEIPDVSRFVSRRVVLGGAKALTGSLLIGAASHSFVGSVALALAARKGSKILSDPSYLNSLTKAIDPSASDKVRNAALFRLVKQAYKSGENEEQQSAPPAPENATPVSIPEPNIPAESLSPEVQEEGASLVPAGAQEVIKAGISKLSSPEKQMRFAESVLSAFITDKEQRKKLAQDSLQKLKIA